jgi:hypothetical protein
MVSMYNTRTKTKERVMEELEYNITVYGYNGKNKVCTGITCMTLTQFQEYVLPSPKQFLLDNAQDNDTIQIDSAFAVIGKPVFNITTTGE